ncbi:MAG TPA: erythromycin esterase family protein [Gemmatimonadaceae bacterium]|nr:erythromycin esterase family protein [Gemmatimonadaceae bacterium]
MSAPVSSFGSLLLGSLLPVVVAAGAHRVAPDTASPGVPPATDSIEQQAAARVADAVCSKRVVLLGELPEHGEARGMGVKARIVERLVARCGFRAVLFEAGSYDFFGLERAIAATPQAPSGRAAVAASGAPTDSLELALARAIGGLWWTRELAGWRQWLVREAVAGRVVIGGIDDQPSATSAYARATLPGLVGAAVTAARAGECEETVARYLGFRYTAAQPYDDTERTRLADCARLAADRAHDARRTADEVMLDDVASYFAREQAAAQGGAAAPPDRDLVMARHVAWWSARLPRNAKVVVWTATTHAARARGAHPVLPTGVPPLGARLAERWGDRLAVIGFTALRGQWSRAGHPSQPLAPLPPHALEARALAARAAVDTAAWTYLDRAVLRSLDTVPSRLFGKVVTTDWSTAFDGVLVIRDESAPTFEPRR